MSFSFPRAGFVAAAGGGGGSSPGTTNLCAYWKLDETTGNRADSHGSFTMETNGSVGYVSDGIQGNAADCDGAQFLKTIAYSAGTLFGASGPFTMAGWVRPSSSIAGFQTFVYALDGGNFILMRFTAAGDISLLIWDTTWVECGLYGHNITDDAWHFVAFGIDGSNKGFIKVDGNARDTDAATLSTQANRATNTKLTQFGSGNPFGDLDEWGIWKQALTDEELDWLYNSGAGKTYADL